MSKVIQVFPDGSAAIVDDQPSGHSLKVSGQEPVETLPVTEANLKQYFPQLDPAAIVLQ